MKLAEALLQRSDMEKKLASLQGRIEKYAVVQHGDKPHEDPAKLMKEHQAVLDAWTELVVQINSTNLIATLPDGRPLTAALAGRDALLKRHALLTAAIAGSSKEPERYSMSEIKWVATMKVADLQLQADKVSKELRELNVQIQSANWATELEKSPALRGGRGKSK